MNVEVHEDARKKTLTKRLKAAIIIIDAQMCTNTSKGCGSMKSELIENLIVAHCSEDEDKFQEAIETLAIDEEKKGNVILANKIRKAYVSKKRSKKGAGEFSTSSSAFS